VCMYVCSIWGTEHFFLSFFLFLFGLRSPGAQKNKERKKGGKRRNRRKQPKTTGGEQEHVN
jgi:hypothetical protein